MSNEIKATTEPSMKVLYGECLEILDILINTEDKLDYAVNGSPSDKMDKAEAPPTGNISIGMLSGIVGNIRRKASNHAKLVNSLTGN